MFICEAHLPRCNHRPRCAAGMRNVISSSNVETPRPAWLKRCPILTEVAGSNVAFCIIFRLLPFPYLPKLHAFQIPFRNNTWEQLLNYASYHRVLISTFFLDVVRVKIGRKQREIANGAKRFARMSFRNATLRRLFKMLSRAGNGNLADDEVIQVANPPRSSYVKYFAISYSIVSGPWCLT